MNKLVWRDCPKIMEIYPENLIIFPHEYFMLFRFFTGWAKTRVFQEKDMGNWVFGFFLLFLGFSGFFLGFWVFQIPYILGISKYVKADRTSIPNLEQYEKSFISPNSKCLNRYFYHRTKVLHFDYGAYSKKGFSRNRL